MASAHSIDDTTLCKTCQCGVGDKKIWNVQCNENSDKQPHKCPNCQILKSGYLFLASRGLGWTSWKKRWFVLTTTSLVFYRSDPNTLPQKGAEANPTIGGIDLNNSGSAVVKQDKKLLTVFFPNGHDGRTFTLKGETLEELQEWKTALENALAQAPKAAVTLGQSGIFRNDIANAVESPVEASFEQSQDKKFINSTAFGRPVLLALEDIDGSPSFLEKAIRFIEDHGIKVEGVLRQSADVEEVKRRVQEYEQGKNEFSSDEDAHVIGDCIKHVLRELPSSPVPASCCTALVEAYRTDGGNRISALRGAISETFPEPNLHLLQRILKMMIIIAAHKAINRMSISALAACMAPLLLRPLLAGDCEYEDNFNMVGDGSLQLLKAAAAANHAQAIVIIMLEEYDRIFDEELSEDGSVSSETYTGSEEDGVEDYDSTDTDNLNDDDGYHDAHNGLDTEDDIEHSSRATHSKSGSRSISETGSGSRSKSGSHNNGSNLSENEEESHISDYLSRGKSEDVDAIETPSRTLDINALPQNISQKPSTDLLLMHETTVQTNNVLKYENSTGSVHISCLKQKPVGHNLPGSPANFRKKLNEPTISMRKPTRWRHTSAKKNLSMESIDFSTEDEIAIKMLEDTKSNLKAKITEEVKDISLLQASLKRRKEALCERRLDLEEEVEKLREQLQKERDFKASLESGLMNMQLGHISIWPAMDNKTREDLEGINTAEADITNLKQKIADLRGQLSHHLQPSCLLVCITCNQQLDKTEQALIVDDAFLHHNENSSNNKASSLGQSIDNHENHSPHPINSLPLIDSKHSKNSTSKGENLPPLAEMHPSKKLPKHSASKSTTKSTDVLSTDDSVTLNQNITSKKSSLRSEDAASSSTLTRLTNRLNFLKERRAQLANEVQSLDVKHTCGSEPPSRIDSR